MTAYVFLGPSLPVATARQHLDAVYLPPVVQGDVHRAALRRPSLIGIVDGTFERMPSVWHKEILWAMDQGIPVLGASSMGALRAAELDAFGMLGVGRIYEAFRDGVLEDDDEVAIVHATAEDGYRPLSDAMVNLRRLCADALEAAVIDRRTHDIVVDVAKRRFYPERHVTVALRDAAEAGADQDLLDGLRGFARRSSFDQKGEDAIALLDELARRLEAGETTIRTRYAFQYSSVWWQAERTAGRLRFDPVGDGAGGAADDAAGADTPTPSRSPTEATTVSRDRVLDELRLDPGGYRRTWQEAHMRASALHNAAMEGYEPDEQQLAAALDDFRDALGLTTPEDARRWLDANDLTNEQAEHLIRDEARVRWVRETGSIPVTDVMPDQLRVAGRYPELAARFREKDRRLREAGLAEVSLEDVGITWSDLLDWFFGDRLDTSTPEDLTGFLAEFGYVDETHLRHVLLREYAFEVLVQPHAVPDAG